MSGNTVLSDGKVTLDGPPLFVEPTTLFRLPFNVVEADDEVSLVAYLKNSGDKTVDGVRASLAPSATSGIEIPEHEIVVDNLIPGISVPVSLPVKTSGLEPGIHSVALNLSAGEKSIQVPVSMPSVKLELGKTTLSNGRVEVMEVLVHTVDGTLRMVEHLRGQEVPATIESRFTHKQGFKGIHREMQFHNPVTTTQKIVAAIASGFGISVATSGVIGAASGVTLAGIGSAIKAVGWKGAFRLIAPDLIPGAGWILLAASVCAAVYNAVAKGSLETGDIHWIGEEDCPPEPDEITLEELDEIDVRFTNHDMVCDNEEAYGLNGPLELSADYSYSRVTNRRCLTCTGSVEEKVDWFLPIRNTQANLDGGELVLTTEVSLPDETPLTGPGAWVHAMALAADGSLIDSAIMLRDDGCKGDVIGNDGIYTARLPVDHFLEQDNPPAQVYVMAQAGTPLGLPLYGSTKIVGVTPPGGAPGAAEKPGGESTAAPHAKKAGKTKAGKK